MTIAGRTPFRGRGLQDIPKPYGDKRAFEESCQSYYRPMKPEFAGFHLREGDMPYVLAASSSPSFALKGLAGYEFQPLKDQDIAMHVLEGHKGHDTFMISNALIAIYYIIEGTC